MPKKILLIEDDPFLTEIYVTKFEQAGYSVEVAEDGKSGYEKVKEMKPDIVLLDIVLPNMEGFEVTEKIKNDPEAKDVMVIMLTNLGSDEDIQKANNKGADGYIVKSRYTPSEIVSRVEEIISS